MNHVLKCWPKYFKAMQEGRKAFEVRKADRDYQVGDTIENKEWDPATGEFTGAQLEPQEITFILQPGEMGLQEGVCVMALRAESEYPKWIESVDRKEDMSPDGRLTLHRQKDGDVVLAIWKGDGKNLSVEFCTSGGRSRNTRRALCELMVAMEKDNEEQPQ